MGAPEHVVIIGLTGGIASGKSTVTGFFRDLGAVVIDADVIAREVVAKGSDGLKAIEETFGSEVIARDGTLDRKALGALVFSDEAKRRELEQITHPRIGQLMWQRASEAFADGSHWVLYDAALLVENGIHQMLDSLVVVSVSPDTQLTRLMARDSSSEGEATARISSQLPLADKVAAADYVIDNGGTREDTRARVKEVYAIIDEAVRTHSTAKPQREGEDA